MFIRNTCFFLQTNGSYVWEHHNCWTCRQIDDISFLLAGNKVAGKAVGSMTQPAEDSMVVGMVVGMVERMLPAEDRGKVAGKEARTLPVVGKVEDMEVGKAEDTAEGTVRNKA